jgi:hypothetical protein
MVSVSAAIVGSTQARQSMAGPIPSHRPIPFLIVPILLYMELQIWEESYRLYIKGR